jgi:hypothetical protein
MGVNTESEKLTVETTKDNDLASLRALPGYAALKRKLTDTSDDDIDE